MAAAAVTSLVCPLRRSSRLVSRRTKLDDEPENELTPRALRALKRQRQPVHLPPKKRRKDSPVPLTTTTTTTTTITALALAPAHPDLIKHPRPRLALPLAPAIPPSPSPEPLTPLTPLTPSPESSPSLPGHDRPPSPPHDTDPPPPPSSLQPPLDTLIPFDGLHPQFPHDLTVPPQPPLELHDPFHAFPQQQLYVPPPLFVRDREINIWKLACQERVDCLLRRYGIDYIKALVKSEARSHPPSPSSSHTKFRLYTPASYTYSSTSWGPRSQKPFPVNDEPDNHEVVWPIDDPDWPDVDIDMDDEDEDDYEDEDETADTETMREGEATLDAVQLMQVDEPPEPPSSPSRPPSPTRPIPLYLPPAPAPPSLPPLSSLHVPLLSEPPRAFMGRGTPPDRRRLSEWSGSGRFTPNGIGPPLYLSPVPQRHPSTDVGIVPMSVDPPPQPPPTNGEWTSFLFSMLEGDSVGVGSSVANTSHPSEWYELGLGSVPAGLDLPLSHPHTVVEQPVEDANSSSTLRFALG